jgi:uncharacterized integral membrane protein
MRFIKFFLGFAVLTIVTIFATSNVHEVPLYAYMGKSLLGYVPASNAVEGASSLLPRKIPVFLIIYISFAAGFLVAGFLSVSSAYVYKRQVKRLNKQLKQQSEELDRLRSIPAAESMSEIDTNSQLPLIAPNP